MENPKNRNESILISDENVRHMFSISQPTLWRWTKYKGFPSAVVRGKRSRNQVIEWAREQNML